MSEPFKGFQFCAVIDGLVYERPRPPLWSEDRDITFVLLCFLFGLWWALVDILVDWLYFNYLPPSPVEVSLSNWVRTEYPTVVIPILLSHIQASNLMTICSQFLPKRLQMRESANYHDLRNFAGDGHLFNN
jgi:hypothetical protein